MMADDMPPGILAEHAIEIYQKVISELSLSARATELADATEALHIRIELLQENIVSSIVILTYICADTQC